MAKWKNIARPLSTADAIAARPTIYQGFKAQDGYRNKILLGVTASIFFYNLPVFSSLKLEIWSNAAGAPGRLLSTSTTSYTMGQTNTDTFAYRILGFTFPKFAVKKNTQYWLALRPAGYTGNAGSHIAWRQSWPDPQYSDGVDLTLEKGLFFPYDAVFTTADL